METTVIGLKGLTCSNCAAKIENDVNRLEYVKEISINILKQEALIEHNGNAEEVFEAVKKITAKYEPNVLVSKIDNGSKTENITHDECHDECNCHGHSHAEAGVYDKIFTVAGSKAFRFSVGIMLFLAAFLVKEPRWLNISLFMASYIVLGIDVLIRAVKNIAIGQIFDENFLMSISTVGAIVIGEMPEAVFVMLFYQIGEAFQDMAVEKSRKSIRDLMNIRPDHANLIVGADIVETKPENIEIDDTIIIKPGERVPLDGIITEGESVIDTSALTGESVPREVRVGNDVLSGTINISGAIKVKVSKIFAESTVVKILELTENAASKKTRTEQFITKFARVYTPSVVAAAVFLAFIPQMLTAEADLKIWVSRALIFLVVSCPCALVLSVPLGFFAGIGEASKKGILIKGSNYLQALCHINTVVLDKTGTVTEGVFQVTQVVSQGIEEKELLRLVAYAEKMSTHPIARSITDDYEKTDKIETNKIEAYEEISGYGVSAIIDGQKIYAGNARLMEKIGIECHIYSGIGSVVYVGTDKAYLGRIVVSDKIKQDSKIAIEKLKKAGITEIVMLTGDNKESAEAVGAEVGVDRVEGGLLPGDKVRKVEDIYSENNDAKILFVGDGINDAPVLSRVEVGVAMGGVGSDAAIEAADVVIMNDSLLKIADGIIIAKNTNRIVKQNIVFALGVKAIVLVLGAMGIATMWLAVFADVGVSFIAILNSMRRKI